MKMEITCMRSLPSAVDPSMWLAQIGDVSEAPELYPQISASFDLFFTLFTFKLPPKASAMHPK